MYLAENPELAANWVREAYIERDIGTGACFHRLEGAKATASVFKVDTSMIGPIEPDPKGGSADWRHLGRIPPSAVRLVYEADYTDDIPDDTPDDADDIDERE